MLDDDGDDVGDGDGDVDGQGGERSIELSTSDWGEMMEEEIWGGGNIGCAGRWVRVVRIRFVAAGLLDTALRLRACRTDTSLLRNGAVGGER
jgi:hypothetical protein